MMSTDGFRRQEPCRVCFFRITRHGTPGMPDVLNFAGLEHLEYLVVSGV